MTDMLSIGPNDYLILETDRPPLPPEIAADVRSEAAETFGIREEQVVILSNLHVRVLRKVPK